MKLRYTVSLLLILSVFSLGFPDESADESVLFSDNQSIVSSSTITTTTLSTFFEKESTTFSGSFLSQASYYLNRKWLEGTASFSNNRLIPYTQANLFLDVRLTKGYKTFLNLNIANLAQSATATNNALAISLKEVFMDMNINKSIYFRTGKQVLQWGRTYLWNPTDLINVEKRSFSLLNQMQYREGAYGAKMHIPFTTAANFYSFADFTNVTNIDEVGIAAKYEIVLSGSEIAFSAWSKKGYMPVYGFDFSTRSGDIDIKGELSLSYGDNLAKVREQNGTTNVYQITNTWVPKISLGFSKYFEWVFKDRISIITEFFYNDSGYSENIFQNPSLKAALLANNLYIMNYYGKYYGAILTSISKFPINDMTFNTNIMSNLADGSGIISTGLMFTPINNFTLGLTLSGFFGPAQAEYTYNGYGYSLDAYTSIIF